MHKTPNQAQLSTPRRAHWPCRGPWPGRVVARVGRVASSRMPCRSPHSRAPCALSRARPALCLAPCRASTPCRAACLPSSPSLVPRLSYRGPSGRVVGAGCAPARPYCRSSAARWLAVSLAVSRHGPASCPQPQSRYTPVYHDTPPPTAKLPPSLPLCHNTISVL